MTSYLIDGAGLAQFIFDRAVAADEQGRRVVRHESGTLRTAALTRSGPPVVKQNFHKLLAKKKQCV